MNIVLVGDTSKGRKGSSWGHIERLAKNADAGWGDRVESGLTSGEGLIWAVRDANGIEKGEKADHGVTDKRLLVFEPEFANVLRVLERQGNRLSAVVRDAWDGRTLRTLTRTTSAKASGAHISIIGHITSDELRRYLDRTEVANGLGNRFLWACVRRSKVLPEGGEMHKVDVGPLVRECATRSGSPASQQQIGATRRPESCGTRSMGRSLPGCPGCRRPRRPRRGAGDAARARLRAARPVRRRSGGRISRRHWRCGTTAFPPFPTFSPSP